MDDGPDEALSLTPEEAMEKIEAMGIEVRESAAFWSLQVLSGIFLPCESSLLCMPRCIVYFSLCTGVERKNRAGTSHFGLERQSGSYRKHEPRVTGR